MKVLLGWFGHETNTFSRRKTDFDLLVSQGSWEGDEILRTFRGTPSYLGGMIKCADEKGVELIPTFGVENAGPTVSDECLERVCDILVGYARKHLGEYQGICIGLHGAGCSETIDDIETYTVKKLREVVGWEMPITATLDLHGNVSQEMCDCINGLFGIKENPHVDYAISGYEAMDALIRTVNGEIDLKTEVVPLPMLVPITVTKDYQEITEFILDYKKKHGLLDLAFFPGFPYSDTPITGASVFVTGDGSQREHALKVARHIWDKRDHIVDIESIGALDAVGLAKRYLEENQTGLCLINEASDNPGGGTPGDGTDLIRAMFDADIENSAFAYIYDPEVVQQAIHAGVGAKIEIELGGKLEDPKYHGNPIHLKNVLVRTISNGSFVATTPLMKRIPGSFGPTVGLQHGNVRFVVASVQNQTYDDRAFFTGGIDFSQMRLIGLKSSQHFKAFYHDLVDKIIPANPPGLSTKDLKIFNYIHLGRFVYPIDEEVSFNPGGVDLDF